MAFSRSSFLVLLGRSLYIKSANCILNSCQPTYQIAVFQSHEFFGTHILVHCSIVAHDALAISGRLSEVSLSPSNDVLTNAYLCRALGRSSGQLLNGSCSRGHGCSGVYPIITPSIALSSILAINVSLLTSALHVTIGIPARQKTKTSGFAMQKERKRKRVAFCRPSLCHCAH